MISRINLHSYTFSVLLISAVAVTSLTGVGVSYSILLAIAALQYKQIRTTNRLITLAFIGILYILYNVTIKDPGYGDDFLYRRAFILADLVISAFLVSNLKFVSIKRNFHIMLSAFCIAATLLFGLEASQNFLGLILIVSFSALVFNPNIYIAIAHVALAVVFEAYTSAIAMLVGYVVWMNVKTGLIAISFGLIGACVIYYNMILQTPFAWLLLSEVPTFYIRFALWHESVMYLFSQATTLEWLFGVYSFPPEAIFTTNFTNSLALPFSYRGRDPHNIFINIIFHFGLVGLVLFMVGMVLTMRGSKRAFAIGTTLLAYFFFETSLGFTTNGLLLVLMWLAIRPSSPNDSAANKNGGRLSLGQT